MAQRESEALELLARLRGQLAAGQDAARELGGDNFSPEYQARTDRALAQADSILEARGAPELGARDSAPPGPGGAVSPRGIHPVQARFIQRAREGGSTFQGAQDLTAGERALGRGVQGAAEALTLGRPEVLGAPTRAEANDLFNLEGQTDLGDVADIAGQFIGSAPLAIVTGGLANVGARALAARLGTRAPRVAQALNALATGNRPEEASRLMKVLAAAPTRNVYEGLAFSAVAGPGYKLEEGEPRLQRIAQEFGIGAAVDFALGLVMGQPGARVARAARAMSESDNSITREIGEALAVRIDQLDRDDVEGLRQSVVEGMAEAQAELSARRQDVSVERNRPFLSRMAREEPAAATPAAAAPADLSPELESIAQRMTMGPGELDQTDRTVLASQLRRLDPETRERVRARADEIREGRDPLTLMPREEPPATAPEPTPTARGVGEQEAPELAPAGADELTAVDESLAARAGEDVVAGEIRPAAQGAPKVRSRNVQAILDQVAQAETAEEAFTAASNLRVESSRLSPEELELVQDFIQGRIAQLQDQGARRSLRPEGPSEAPAGAPELGPVQGPEDLPGGIVRNRGAIQEGVGRARGPGGAPTADDIAAVPIDQLAPTPVGETTPRQRAAAERAIRRANEQFEEEVGFLEPVMERPREATETVDERMGRIKGGEETRRQDLARGRAARLEQTRQRLEAMPEEHRAAVQARLQKLPEHLQNEAGYVGDAVQTQERAIILGLAPDTPLREIQQAWWDAPLAVKNIELRQRARQARARGEKPTIEPPDPTPEEEELIAELARRTEGFAAERRSLTTDPTSGLPNQQSFLMAQPRIDADPDQGWAAIDLINFKVANDVVSIEEGNRVLETMGRILTEVADEMGLPVRNLWRAGGDEFFVAGPPELAHKVARRATSRFAEVAPSYTNAAGETYQLGARMAVGPTVADANAGLKVAKASEEGPRYRDVTGAREKTSEKQAVVDEPPEVTDRMREMGFEEHPRPLRAAIDRPGQLSTIPEHLERIQKLGDATDLTERQAIDAIEVELKTLGEDYGHEVEDAIRTSMGLNPTDLEPTLKVQSTIRRQADAAAETWTPGEPVSVKEGRTIEIETPDGPVQVRYALMSVDDLTPSHDPFTWEPSQGYFPEGRVQQRDYRANVANREGVERIVGQPRVQRLIDPTRLAQEGPPVVTRDGNAVAGNSRAMAMLRLRREKPEVFQELQEATRRELATYGLEGQEVGEGDVLVRVLTDEAVDQADVNQLRELNIAWDREIAKAKTSVEDAASRAAVLDERGEVPLTHLDETLDIENGQTLRAYLSTAKGREFIKQLREIGFFSQEEAGRMIREDGFLTDRGRDAVEESLLMAAVGNPEVVRLAPPLIKTRLEHAVPQIVALRQDGGAWDLSGTISEALELHARLAADEGFTGRRKVFEYRNQQSLFGSEFTPRAMDLAQALEEGSKRDITEAFRVFFREAEISKRQGQSDDLFGFEPKSPEDAYDEMVRSLLPKEEGGPC